MKIGNFNIIPEPVKNGELRIIGPYNLIRHPMYTSLILFTLPELINYFTYFRLMVFVLLVISLILKISYEEMRLLESFDEYAKYKARTKKLIPFVF